MTEEHVLRTAVENNPEHLEHLMAIGRVAARHAMQDEILSSLLISLTNVQPDVGQQMMAALRLPAKLDMAQKLAKAGIGILDKHRGPLVQLLGRAGAVNKKRNTVIHSLLVHQNGSDLHYITLAKIPSTEPVTTADADEVADEIGRINYTLLIDYVRSEEWREKHIKAALSGITLKGGSSWFT